MVKPGQNEPTDEDVDDVIRQLSLRSKTDNGPVEIPPELGRLMAERLKPHTKTANTSPANDMGESSGQVPANKETKSLASDPVPRPSPGRQLDLQEMPRNLHSHEIEDILGTPPQWIIRVGIMIIALLSVLLLAGSWFIRYPDIISAPISISNVNPPQFLTAKAGGPLANLLVDDNQTVFAGQYLGIIENTADYHQIMALKSALDNFKTLLDSVSSPTVAMPYLEQFASLGDLQEDYRNLRNSLKDYHEFFDLKVYGNRITSLRGQIRSRREHLALLRGQQQVLEEKLALTRQQMERTEKLFDDGLISNTDYEDSKAALLNEQYSLDGARIGISSSELQLMQLERSLKETQEDSIKTMDGLWSGLEHAANRLSGQIRSWEQRYAMIAPFDGTVSFFRIWAEGQFINAGDIAMIVIPSEPGDIIGHVELPAAGAGKVKVHQQVNIKFASYPDAEFGIVRGVVISKSLVPAEDIYMVEIGFPERLVTNFGFEIHSDPQMQGIADIITEDISLFQRLINLGKSKLGS